MKRLLGAAMVFFSMVTGAFPQSLDEDFRALGAYLRGEESGALERIVEAVSAAHDTGAQRRELASRLAAVLGDGGASDAARWFAARQLSRVASDAEVGTIAPLLRRSDTVDMARYVLERLPGYQAQQALLDGMRNTRGETRIGIIDSLGERGDPSAVAHLRRLSGNGDSATMRAAIVAMGKIGGDEAANATRWCAENIRYDLRPVATEAFLRCADKFLAEGDRERAAIMYEYVYIPAEKTELRMAALRGLLQAEPERAPERIIDTLLNEEPEMKNVAAESISLIDDEAGITALAEALPRLPAEYQAHVLDALARHPVPSGREATIAAARNANGRVGSAAIGALSAYGDAETITMLLRLAASGDESVREAARSSLVRMEGPIVNDRLAQAAISPDNGIRAEALHAITGRRAEEALPIVLRACEREVGGIRVLALESLGSIATVKELPFLVDQFKRAESVEDRAAANGAIVATAKRLGPGEARIQPIVKAMSGGRSSENDIALINILGQVGDDAAIPALLNAAKNRDGAVREAAVRALGRWNSPGALDALREIMAKAKTPAEERLAVDGYLRLLSIESDRGVEETLALYQALTVRPLSAEQKRQLLSGLAALEDGRALPLAMRYVADPEVEAEAAVAIGQLEAAE